MLEKLILEDIILTAEIDSTLAIPSNYSPTIDSNIINSSIFLVVECVLLVFDSDYSMLAIL